MFAPLIHILPLATIMRTRLMPVEGKIIIGIGQKVNPTDVVAEAIVGRKHLVIDIAQKLNVAQRDVPKFLRVKKGQQIAKNDVLAETPGLFGKEVPAPAAGTVVATGGGKIVIETGGAVFELRAGIPGIVAQTIGGRGVVIRATGGVVQGVWGNGKLDFGTMHSLMETPDEIFDPGRIDVSLRGTILLGGHLESPKVLQNAVEMSVRGLIVPSINPALLQSALQAPFPILVLEGFGRRPMNPSAYKLLSTNVKRDVSLNAEMPTRSNPSSRQEASVRPEVFIPLPVSQEPPEPRQVETFAPGQVVRVMFLSKPGRQGTILNLRPMATLPNGIQANAAEVRLENGEQILSPLTNLEVVG
ncbi:MAG: hypothetical protein DDG60_00465 [Anaerolineae bacterium]|nr:MAG: hypothetical protein DDG60_00465 [Anaerolineae bacterium]